MQKTYSKNIYSLIGEYRKELMGFAILWVMFFHMTFNTWNKGLYFLHTVGFFGVDMFFILSAYGLYYSLSKKNTIEFYKARILRIYPLYILIATVFFFRSDLSGILNYLLYVTGIGYWLGFNYFEWYVPTIVMFYLCSPLIYKLFSSGSNIRKVLYIVGSIFISLGLSLIAVQCGLNYMIGSLTRIPVFIIGFYIASLSVQNKPTGNHVKYIILAIFIVGILISYYSVMYLRNEIYLYGFDCYPAILLATTLCFVLVYVFNLLKKLGAKTYKTFSFPLMWCGTLSLELYLIHQRIRDMLLYSFPKNQEVTILLITLGCAVILHVVVEVVERWVLNINFKLK